MLSDYGDFRQRFDLFSDPAEASFLIGMRIENPGYLMQCIEEILVNEEVVIREENAKPWVRVIPADDGQRRKLRVLHLVDMLPSVLRKRDVRAALGCAFSHNTGGDTRDAIGGTANEYAADFRAHGAAGVLADLLEHTAGKLHSWRCR